MCRVKSCLSGVGSSISEGQSFIEGQSVIEGWCVG